MPPRTAQNRSPARPRHVEIEAKYTVPDPRTFERLNGLHTFSAYRLVPHSEQDVADVYVDTDHRDLMAAGWACRVRDGLKPGHSILTLKSLGKVRGALHRREEHECEIEAGLAPDAW